MGKLIYSVIASADGYVEDAAGRFEWAAPDEEVMRLVNDLERPVGTYLYGRRMYQTMLYWETAGTGAGEQPADRQFAQIWRAADKIVFSSALDTAATAKTRIERRFDPDLIRQLKSASARDLSVGGADLAGQAIRAGLVDELQLILVPALVGGGKRALPDGARADLELLQTRQFSGGTVYLRYGMAGPAGDQQERPKTGAAGNQ